MMALDIKPMLATLVDKPFDREGWIFEMKWDGYRIIAKIRNQNAKLFTRNAKDYTEIYRPVAEELAKLKQSAVLDGEMVIVDTEGISRFQLLQNYHKTKKGNLRYIIFDILELNGKDLRFFPLIERKAILKNLLRPPRNTTRRGDSVAKRSFARLIYGDHIKERGIDFFKIAVGVGAEGVVAKNAQSTYQSGQRSLDWLKIKSHMRQEVVIGGFTEPRGSRKHLGALILGVYQDDKLVYVGHTGGRLGSVGLAEMRNKLERLEIPESPFVTAPKPNAPVHWVKPKLVCEVTFQEWTEAGHMRQPIFQGMRADKNPKDVKRDKPKTYQPR